LSPHLQQGLLVPAEGHIDNRHLLEVLLHTCQRLGVILTEHSEVSVAPGIIHSPNRTHHFDRVLDCRGTGAKPQWSQVRGVRGEVMRVHAPDLHLQRPLRLLHPRYQLYVVPKPGQQYVIGATQLESEDRSPMSLQSMLELGSALYTLSPAFAEARIIEQSTNLRPALPDNRPHIHWEEGLIRLNGLFRHGYLLAPLMCSHLLEHLHAPLYGGHPHPLPFTAALPPLTPSTPSADLSAQEPLPYV
jgi:glycine oxidase